MLPYISIKLEIKSEAYGTVSCRVLNMSCYEQKYTLEKGSLSEPSYEYKLYNVPLVFIRSWFTCFSMTNQILPNETFLTEVLV